MDLKIIDFSTQFKSCRMLWATNTEDPASIACKGWEKCLTYYPYIWNYLDWGSDWMDLALFQSPGKYATYHSLEPRQILQLDSHLRSEQGTKDAEQIWKAKTEVMERDYIQ